MVYPVDEGIEEVSYHKDDDAELYQEESWFKAAWNAVTPWGLRSTMNWIKGHYPGVDVYITENGTSDKVGLQESNWIILVFSVKLGNLDDLQRIYYYKHYINQLLKSILLDGVQVKGYYAWSLLDNFEWASGYTEKFGLTRVNYTDPNRTRTPKQSFKYFSKLIKQNGFSESDSSC